MCGLFGTFNAPDIDVAAGLDRIRHRGPDGDGIVSAGPAVHGHVRLALVDLSAASAQPFRRGAGVLSFTGEIWNYRELRAELVAAGESFVTTGDTEVLAAALDHWGEAALDRLEGMFTFAWSKGDRHILARDRFGKVPLYVHRAGDRYAWSNERKGLGLAARPLPPGSVLDLTTGALRCWYRLPDQAPDSRKDIVALLDEGVRWRIQADAPLCCLISGGLDSSLVLLLAKRHKPDLVAYTAVLDPASPDLAAARRLCAVAEVPLFEVTVTPPTAADLTRAALAIEIPSKAQTEIAAMCLPLAAAIGADGFKACLSGEAADELFGGYGSMCIKGSKADDRGWRSIRTAQLDKMARGNFVRCNKVFMAHGVECRLPYMHRGLVESVLAMSKAECPPGKRALKAAAAAIVPEWIVKRPKDTFQGAAGMDRAAADLIADPRAFYRAEIATAYGRSALADFEIRRSTAPATRSRGKASADSQPAQIRLPPASDDGRTADAKKRTGTKPVLVVDTQAAEVTRRYTGSVHPRRAPCEPARLRP